MRVVWTVSISLLIVGDLPPLSITPSLNPSICVTLLLWQLQTYGFSRPWVLTAWYVIYWTTFTLTWLVLPIMYSYLDSGYFTIKSRLLDALKGQVRRGSQCHQANGGGESPSESVLC